MRANYTDDPELFASELGEAGRFDVDLDTGIEFYRPGRKEAEELNAEMLREIRAAEQDHAAYYKRLHDNECAYEGIVDTASGEKPMLVVPIVKRDCDAIVAWFVNTIIRPHPVFSFDPCFPAEYDVPIDDPTFGRVVLPTTAEQVAASLELAVEYVIQERIKFRSLVETVIGETVRGRGPSIVKVVFDRKYHYEFITDIQAGPLNVAVPGGVRKVKKESGDPVRVYAIPAENFLMPADEEHPLTSRWVAEKTPMTTPEVRREVKRPGCLIPVAEWTALTEATGDVTTDAQKEFKASVDGRLAQTPRNRHDVREVWFTHWVEDEGEVRMQGLFHMRHGKFIWISRNLYNHQRNPYVAFFQKKRPFRFSGSSTAEEIAVIQKIASEILHLRLQNAVVHNSSPIIADPNSDAFEFLQENEIDSLSVIPGRPDEVRVLDFGRAHGGLMEELGFVLDLGSSVSGQNKYKSGDYIPGRTSPNTVEQIMNAGMQVPLSQLLGYADSFCEMMWLYLRTYKQFRPYGEILYVQDRETKEMLEVAFRLPDEEALDNFKCSLTAANEMAQEEMSIENLSMLANLLDKDAEQLARIVGPFADLQMPDSIAAIFERIIERKQDVISMFVSRIRTDASRFVVTKQMLRSVADERNQMKEQQQIAAQQPAVQQRPAGGGADGNPVQPAPAAIAA